MKDKFGLTKIENPYKIFLRNIQIGIFIILFLFGSLFAGTAVFNKLEDNAFAATTTTVTIYGNGGNWDGVLRKELTMTSGTKNNEEISVPTQFERVFTV